MKPKTHLRIVCLKNTKSSKSYYNNQSSSLQNGAKHINQTQNSVVPNLVYLSARLQQDQKNIERCIIGSSNKQLKQLEQGLHYGLRDRKEISLRQIDEKELTIQKYFHKKRESSQKSKLTIRNMMGSIDFSSDKKKQRKVSKHIKQTLQKDTFNHRFHKKNNNKEQLSNNSFNRVFLEQDFRNFLNNKEYEYKNPKFVDLKQEENRKLRKLTIVNPEKQKLKEFKDNSKSLNLFNFLSINNQKKMISPSNHSGLLRLDPVSSNLRLQKKIIKMALNLKTQQYDFEWKKLEAEKGFDFAHINHE